jgi:hypothetical protein
MLPLDLVVDRAFGDFFNGLLETDFTAHRPHGVSRSTVQVFGVGIESEALHRRFGRIQATIVSDYAPSTESLEFRENGPSRQEAALERGGAADGVELERADTTHPAFSATLSKRTDGSAVLVVEFDREKWLEAGHAAYAHVYGVGRTSPLVSVKLRVR